MRDVMDALAELQAANEAIETAGPLYQTREPLKDKIVCLIGQRSDLITQVLALRRELDAAHTRTHELEARLAEVERERDEARYQLARSHQSEKCTLDPQTCKEAECFACGVLMCPHAEPMHLHHDGCPACHGAALAKAREEGYRD